MIKIFIGIIFGILVAIGIVAALLPRKPYGFENLSLSSAGDRARKKNWEKEKKCSRQP
jgi:hypothetical protein